jgi:glycosyltransferase involved in cell wall biosynthesis
MSCFLITGPGHHSVLLRKALFDATKTPFLYTVYWPAFSVYRQENSDQSILIHQSLFLNFLNKVLWFVANKIKILKKNNKHVYLSYCLYDCYVRSQYKGEKKLWAWAQVSLFTIRKAKKNGAKVILEHPMIHCKEWQSIMKNAATTVQYPYLYSTFSEGLMKRTQEEYQEADHINLLSSFAKTTFLKHGLADSKLYKTSLYADNSIFYPTYSREQKQQQSVLKILFVGRIDLLKGAKELFMALNQWNKPYHLTMVGDLYDEVKDFIPSIKKNITLNGVATKSELQKLYAEADLLILPSLQEAFGLVILESMLCGTPVLGSSNSGAPDIISHQEDGFVFNPFKREELLAGLDFFYQQIVVEGKKYSKNCHSKVINNFTEKAYKERICNLYILSL